MPEKVLLVNTNFTKPLIAPIGLDYLAEAILDAGLTPVIADLPLDEKPEESLRRAISSESPAVVGVTVRNIDDCYMSTGESFIPGIKKWIELIKTLTDAPVVLGGAGYSISPGQAVAALNADYGIKGDGERPLAELAQCIAKGKSPLGIPGLLYRRGDKIIENPPSPCPGLKGHRREYIDNPTYFRLGGQGSLETKRGCDMGCVYCADPAAKGRNIRTVPPSEAAEEFKALISQGVNVIHLCDSEFNIPHGHAEEVCKALMENKIAERAAWYAYLSPAPFTAELADLMKRAGCAGINFGADSAHPDILRNLGRSHSPEDIESAVRLCRRYGITVMLDLLLGGPGENIDTALHTIEAVRKFDPDRAGISLGVRVFQGTKMENFVTLTGANLARPRNYPGDELLYPAFYISPELGADPAGEIARMVGDDERFFFAGTDKSDRNYNYNDNTLLLEAIEKGHRGAYWDILRKLARKT